MPLPTAELVKKPPAKQREKSGQKSSTQYLMPFSFSMAHDDIPKFKFRIQLHLCKWCPSGDALFSYSTKRSPELQTDSTAITPLLDLAATLGSLALADEKMAIEAVMREGEGRTTGDKPFVLGVQE